MIYVQFKDSSKKEIVSVFSSPQVVANLDYYDEIEKSDERYISFIKSLENYYPIINNI